MPTEKNTTTARNQLILSMVIFGTIGIFRKYIPLPSSVVAMARGAFGTVFLLVVLLVKGERISRSAIRKNLRWLFLSGVFLGFNWILLFEAYRYTTVATATLCYYLAPVFITLAAPFFLKERLTAKKVICVAVALLGMVFVSGVLQAGFTDIAEFRGIGLGISAALLYAAVVLTNKKITDISAYDKTITQLGVSAVVLTPYVFITEDVHAAMGALTPVPLFLLLMVAIVHTGVAYALYFGSLKSLKAQTAAMLSYIDPVVAIVLSALVLKEPMDIWAGVGAVMVLGAAFVGELPEKAKG